MSLFTVKTLTQTIGSNDINIYLPSFTIRNRCSRAISFFRMLYKIEKKTTTTEEGKRIYLVNF